MIKKIIVVLLFLNNAGAFTQGLKDRADSVLLRFPGSGTPAIVALVKVKNEVKYLGAAGYANIDKKLKADGSTLFYLPGLSSQYTAMAVMKLMEQGRLKYSEIIRDIISELPEYCNTITIKNLLQNSSGLPFIVISDSLNIGRPVTNAQVVALLNKYKQLEFSPGKKIQINPLNDILLSLIIERKLLKPYAVCIKSEVCDPLGIKAQIYPGKVKAKKTAVGYLPGNNVFKPDITWKLNGITGYYGVFSSITGHAALVDAFYTETLLKRSTIDEAMKLNFLPGYFKYCSFGWHNAFNNGKRYDYQMGNGMGFTHIVLRIPDEEITVIIFTNSAGVFDLRKDAFRLLNLYSSYKYKPE